MSQVGFYYFRGHALKLLRDQNGNYFVKGMPEHLRDAWKRDLQAGKVKTPNH